MVVGREAFYDGANLTLLVSGSDRPASSALVSFLGPVMPQITHEQRRRRREKIAQAVASGRSVSAAVRQFRVTRSPVYRACADTIIRKFVNEGVVCPRKILIRSDTCLLTQPNPASLDNVNTPSDLEHSVLEAAS